MLKRLLAFTFIAFTGWSAQDIPVPAGEGLPTAQEISSVLNELSAITGFQVRRQLPFAMVTREEVNRFLKDQIRKSIRPQEVRAEEITLKKFGFVRPDFDLKRTTIDLLTEQAAAYYDFHRKKLFISDWASRSMREAALIHELAHALADQNYSIQKFLGRANDDSEQSLARQSVVEGQASWLMIEVAARRQGRTLADVQTAATYLRDSGDDDSGYPVFSRAPLYLKRTLMFPYDQGEKFQQAVFMRDGKKAFTSVFLKPPSSSAQILHPERYFADITFGNPPLPAATAHSKQLIKGTLGELDQRILLRQYLDDGTANDLSPKFKGGAYRIDEEKSDHRTTLVYASEWESDAAASEYFEAYGKVLRGKWKSVEVARQDAKQFTGKSEDGYFAVALNGNRVLSEEGFASPL